jgi:hypothetical protein
MSLGKSINLTRLFDYKGRAAELTIGVAATYLINTLFDLVLYPYVIYNFGIIKGGIVMTFLSFLACIGIMKFYDWSKRDWIGIEAIKDLKGYEGEKKIGRFTSWFLKRSEPVIFIFLSIQYDPFVTTAYLRHGKFNGMSRRDWSIFTASVVISNAYWTLAVYMGISLVEWAWKALAG